MTSIIGANAVLPININNPIKVPIFFPAKTRILTKFFNPATIVTTILITNFMAVAIPSITTTKPSPATDESPNIFGIASISPIKTGSISLTKGKIALPILIIASCQEVPILSNCRATDFSISANPLSTPPVPFFIFSIEFARFSPLFAATIRAPIPASIEPNIFCNPSPDSFAPLDMI